MCKASTARSPVRWCLISAGAPTSQPGKRASGLSAGSMFATLATNYITMSAHTFTQCWDITGNPNGGFDSQAIPGVPLDARETAPDHEIAAGGHQADDGVDSLQLQLGL